MDTIQKLTAVFREFPGIGPRQAKRFVYFLLTKNNSYIETMNALLKELKKDVRVCNKCFRFFPPQARNTSTLCSICADKRRDAGLLMVVPRDVDLESIEKSGSYRGYYFVLGGTVPILEKEPEKMIRAKELFARVRDGLASGLTEIIVAMNLDPEGENTAEFVTSSLSPLAKKGTVKISALGRGLSTGTELEYSDAETIKNALRNRT